MSGRSTDRSHNAISLISKEGKILFSRKMGQFLLRAFDAGFSVITVLWESKVVIRKLIGKPDMQAERGWEVVSSSPGGK